MIEIKEFFIQDYYCLQLYVGIDYYPNYAEVDMLTLVAFNENTGAVQASPFNNLQFAIRYADRLVKTRKFTSAYIFPNKAKSESPIYSVKATDSKTEYPEFNGVVAK